jgi:hypothetical protein
VEAGRQHNLRTKSVIFRFPSLALIGAEAAPGTTFLVGAGRSATNAGNSGRTDDKTVAIRVDVDSAGRHFLKPTAGFNPTVTINEDACRPNDFSGNKQAAPLSEHTTLRPDVQKPTWRTSALVAGLFADLPKKSPAFAHPGATNG